MASRTPALMASRSSWFDLVVFSIGMAVAVRSAIWVADHPEKMQLVALLCIPVIVVVARFPMVLDTGQGGIEVGFDSCILMFLLCTQHPYVAWWCGR